LASASTRRSYSSMSNFGSGGANACLISEPASAESAWARSNFTEFNPANQTRYMSAHTEKAASRSLMRVFCARDVCCVFPERAIRVTRSLSRNALGVIRDSYEQFV
jgi:hypothetical protein